MSKRNTVVTILACAASCQLLAGCSAVPQVADTQSDRELFVSALSANTVKTLGESRAQEIYEDFVAKDYVSGAEKVFANLSSQYKGRKVANFSDPNSLLRDYRAGDWDGQFDAEHCVVLDDGSSIEAEVYQEALRLYLREDWDVDNPENLNARKSYYVSCYPGGEIVCGDAADARKVLPFNYAKVENTAHLGEDIVLLSVDSSSTASFYSASSKIGPQTVLTLASVSEDSIIPYNYLKSKSASTRKLWMMIDGEYTLIDYAPNPASYEFLQDTDVADDKMFARCQYVDDDNVVCEYEIVIDKNGNAKKID